MHPQLSIIIPAYNEAERIEPTLDSFYNYLYAGSLDFEIVVVDDGSSDETVEVVRRIAERLGATDFGALIRCVECGQNRGKGAAVRRGMLAARGDIRLMADADGSMPATEIPKLVQPIRRGECDIAIGSRYVGAANARTDQPWFRRAWSRLANRVVQRTLAPGIEDTQCGFKAFTADAARTVFARTLVDGWAFDLEALALANRLGFTVQEIGVSWTDDDRSRINPIRDAVGVVREWFTIYMNFRRGVYSLPALAAASRQLPAQV